MVRTSDCKETEEGLGDPWELTDPRSCTDRWGLGGAGRISVVTRTIVLSFEDVLIPRLVVYPKECVASIPERRE